VLLLSDGLANVGETNADNIATDVKRLAVEGVTTTIPFLARVIRHPDFISGNVDTRFLEREAHLLRPET